MYMLVVHVVVHFVQNLIVFLCFFFVFFSNTPQRVRGEYVRVRACPGKAGFCLKRLYRASGLHFSYNTSQRVRGEYVRVRVSPFLCFVFVLVFFVCSSIFCLLSDCVGFVS